MRQPEPRASAAWNALIVLVATLAALLVGSDTTGIDHREHRPWGCQTCPIPEPAAPPASPTGL